MKRRELPEQLSEKQVRQLAADVFYPSGVYLSAFGLKAGTTAIKDYENGIINPLEVRFKGLYRPFRPRTHGQRVGLMIRGREIRRVYKEGRQPGRYSRILIQKLEESGVEAS